MEQTASNTPVESPSGTKPTFMRRIRSEFREVFGMFLYLWVLFAFSLITSRSSLLNTASATNRLESPW
jgi:hypothetical protein